MKKPPAKLEALWRKKLAESGFQDLEGADRDGPLSNRGKLHDGTGAVSGEAKVQGSSTDGDWEHFQHRVESGAEYTRWAQDVLLAISDDKNPSLRQRAWKLHTEGMGMRGIAAQLGVNFHVVRDSINETARRFRCPKKASLPEVLSRVETPVLMRLTKAVVQAIRCQA